MGLSKFVLLFAVSVGLLKYYSGTLVNKYRVVGGKIGHGVDHSKETVLITGANAGLGFEAARQAADERGYKHVILVVRNKAKGEAAKEELVKLVGKDVFSVAVADISSLKSVRAAAKKLVDQGTKIDVLILNAGLAKDELTLTEDGIEITLAVSAIGHHQLTVDLIEGGALNEGAYVIASGSEAASYALPMPGMGIKAFPYTSPLQTFEDFATGKFPAASDYTTMGRYADAKYWLALWSTAAQRHYPAYHFVTVSPGGCSGSTFADDVRPALRILMQYVFPVVGPVAGLDGSVEQGAQRYLDVANLGSESNGKFYASTPGKTVGWLEVQSAPHFLSVEAQEKVWKVSQKLIGK